MIQALLHGKLSREQENMEDMLTSAVFGLLGYMAPDEGLLPLLRLAQDLRGGCPLRGIQQGAKADIEFWPLIEEPGWRPCEPDVIVRLTRPGERRLCVLVEAKLRSPKSSEAEPESESPYDQLAREWGNLTVTAGREKSDPVLIYLTADYEIPAKDMEASIMDYQGGGHRDLPQLLWLSWRHVWAISRSGGNDLQCDLRDMLERLYLYFYHGVGQLDAGGLSHWSYTR